jgi:hypothetical protein
MRCLRLYGRRGQINLPTEVVSLKRNAVSSFVRTERTNQQGSKILTEVSAIERSIELTTRKNNTAGDIHSVEQSVIQTVLQIGPLF